MTFWDKVDLVTVGTGGCWCDLVPVEIARPSLLLVDNGLPVLDDKERADLGSRGLRAAPSSDSARTQFPLLSRT